MNPLKPGETLIAREIDFRSGTIGGGGRGVKDAYDIYLARTPNKNYVLVVYMTIQFLFHDTTGFVWNQSEKRQFVTTFETSIKAAWGNNRTIRTLPSGKVVKMDIRFNSWIEGWTWSEHWEVHVKKIKPGSFNRSFVRPGAREAHLDSEDVNIIRKQGGGRQRAIVHEFGHMLGLPDEYKAGSTHQSDSHSIMHGGEQLRARHNTPYGNWLDNVLKEEGIK